MRKTGLLVTVISSIFFWMSDVILANEITADFNGDGYYDTFTQALKSGEASSLQPKTGNSISGFHISWNAQHPGIPAINDWSEQYYTSFSENLNTSPGDELLLVGKRQIILLHGDIITPIVTYNEIKNAIISWDINGQISYQTFDLDVNPDEYNIYFGDFNGDEIQEILFQGKSRGSNLYILDGNGNIKQTISNGFKGLDWSGASYQLTIVDINKDGRDDIQMESLKADIPDNFAYSNASGTINHIDLAYHLDESPKTATLAGTIGGEFNVNESGAATYTLPISLPSGTADVTPNIALNYSSHGGNSNVGIGWGVSGFSSITRCPKNYEQNNEIKAVTHSINDIFCIDGQQLFKQKDDDTYGGNGVKYQTELFSNNTITSYNTDGNSGNGPEYFTVKTRDGDTHYYGKSNSESVNAVIVSTNNSVNSTWLLEKTVDLAGNYIQYVYAKNNEGTEHYIDEILYTGNNTLNFSPYNKIDFVYADEIDVQFERVDRYEGYHAGSKVSLSKLLKQIRIYSNQAHLKTYQLYHQLSSANRVYQLNAIQECTYLNNCFQPINFKWSDRSTGYEKAGQYFANKPTSYNLRVADLDASGKSDLISYVNGKLYLNIDHGTQFSSGFSMSQSEFNSLKLIDIGANGATNLMYFTGNYWRLLNYSASSQTFSASALRISNSIPVDNLFVVDLDGDGRQDILDTNSNKWYRQSRYGVLENICPPAESYPPSCTKTVYYPFNYNPISYSFSSGTSTNVHDDLVISTKYDKSARFSDFNGDGVTDLIVEATQVIWDDTRDIWQNPDSPPTPSTTTSGIFSFVFDKISAKFKSYGYIGPDTIQSITPFDINSDGLTDVLFVENNKWYYRINRGGRQGLTGKIDSGIPASTTEADNNKIVLLDHNHNGKIDFWVYQDTNNTPKYSVYEFVDGEFKYKKQISNIPENPVAYYAMLAGYGYNDLILVSQGDNNWERWRLYEADTALRTDLITQITSGYDVATTINYSSLTNSNIYSRNAYGSYPNIYLTTPMMVVSKVESDTATYDSNGTEQTVAVSYQYEDLRAHLNGRGMLGFKKLTTIDEQSGIITTTEYEQYFPFIGYPKSTIRKLVDSNDDETILSEATNTWAQSTKQGQVFPYLSQSHEKNWSLISDSTPSDLTNNTRQFINQVITTNSTYDAYGNLTSSTILNTDQINGGKTGQWFETTTASTYGNSDYESKYARLTNVTVTKTRSDVSGSEVESSSFEYFAESAKHDGSEHSGYAGMLKSETSFSGNDQVKKTYAYDKWGNKTKSTIEAKKRNAVTLTYDTSASSRSTITKYDTKGRFVESIKNDLDHEETFTYDSRFGGVLTQTGPNGLSTHFKYDETGMKYESKGVDGTYSQTYLYLCGTSGISCPNKAEYYSETKAYASDGSLMSGYAREFYNKLGQKIVTAKETFGGKVLITRIEYDKFGRVSKGYQPVFGTVDTIANSFTLAKYDALGRLYEEEAPGARITSKIFNGLSTTTTNAIGQTVVETKNINGDLLSVTDNAGKTMTYVYNGKGNFTTLTDSQSNSIVNVLDSVTGRKTQTIDPDKGTWDYYYNGFGELIRQKDARGVVIIQEYDELGRMIRRVDNAAVNEHESVSGIDVQTTCWHYDTAKLGDSASTIKGALHSVKLYVDDISCSNPDNVTPLQEKITDYDALARPESVMQKLKAEGSSAVEQYLVMNVYNETTGRIDYSILPESVTVKSHYDDYGNVIKLTDGLDENKLYHEVKNIDEFGNLVEEKFGNNITTNRSYNQNTGYLESIIVGLNSSPVVNFSQGFDKIGNVISRTDHIANRLETFGYAEGSVNNLLNRLTSFKVNGTSTKNYSYDELGRMKSKSDMGDDYRYGEGSAGLHAVSSIYNGTVKKRSFTYDAGGNLTFDTDHANSNNNREIRYAAFEKPIYIKKGTSNPSQITFRYGSSRERYRRIDNVYEGSTAVTIETTYLGNYEKVVHTGGAKNGDVEHKYYIGGVALKIDTDKADGSRQSKTRYMHKDHLGSVIAISDESGGVVQQFRYDPFGKQYEITSQSPYLDTAITHKLEITDRGFTGHEMLNSVDIIHMNGRIYDANIGRFLQADAYVQAPKNMQNMDRYAYVLNNPLSYTDPTGHFFKALKKYWRAIAAIAINIWLPGAGGLFTGFWGAVATGAISGVVATGSLKGALIGAFSAGVFFGIGEAFNKIAYSTENLVAGYKAGVSLADLAKNGYLTAAQTVGKVLAHAAAGGVMSKLSGGKFGHGALSAGITQAFAKSIDGIDSSTAGFSGKRVFAAALLGGSVSKLTGGKFANGAVTAAFSRAFNDESHWRQKLSSAKDWVAENGGRVITTVGGTIQVVTGAGLCSTGLGCVLGAPLIAHGANNIYEGVTGEDGLLREGYQAASKLLTGDEVYGDYAYGAVDVGTSLGGATKLVLKPDSWKLFRNIPSDYTRAYSVTAPTALVTNAVVDTNTIIDTYNRGASQ
ncbi:DUF4225 domain-containing protein [Aliikangiella maris]|uniref:DUF4225 domain-containing protein n=2 Tax=Aliikangiella maris TaxID=3162458 RepID=A0ABV3MTH5_9GAMM